MDKKCYEKLEEIREEPLNREGLAEVLETNGDIIMKENFSQMDVSSLETKRLVLTLYRMAYDFFPTEDREKKIAKLEEKFDCQRGAVRPRAY